MNAVKYYGVHDVRFSDMEEKPVPKAGEVLVRVAYAGICGSDLHIYNKGMFIQEIPGIMGHEFVGHVEQIGEDVRGFHVGDVVAGNPMVTCGHCAGCLSGYPNTCGQLAFIGEVCPGCFAEYIVLKEDKLIRIPDGANLKRAALTEPLAVALNICERAQLSETDEIAVLGAGPIGLLTVLAAKQIYHVKSVTVLGRSAFRMELAKKLGADRTVAAFEEEDRFAKVIEATGKPEVLLKAIRHTMPCGAIYVVSIFEENLTLDINELVAAQIGLVGCNAYEERHLWQAADVLAKGLPGAEKLITAELDLSECKQAFEALNARDKRHAKILFRVNPDL